MTTATSAERLGPVGFGERDAILRRTADRVYLDPKVRSLVAR